MHKSFADRTCTHLGFNVFFYNGIANIGKNQIPDIPSQFSFLNELNGRNAQGFLPDLAGIRVIPAGHGTADIGLMAFYGCPGKKLAVVKNGFKGCDIGILVAPAKNIVM